MLNSKFNITFEQELEELISSDDALHPIHRVVYDGGSMVAGTGSTDNACQMCSPSSDTRCGGGFTKCG